MSENKNHLKEIMIWASESPENKKKAIQAFAFAIHTLSNTDKKLNEKELEKLAGGGYNDPGQTIFPNLSSEIDLS